MAWNTDTILIVFVAFTGVAVMLQACVLLAIFISLRKSARAVHQTIEDMKATIIPIAHSTRALVERISPQVMSISAGLAELTEIIKKETHGVSFSVAEIMERVNRQTQRLDVMLTSGLNIVDRAGIAVETAVAAPVRQVNGIMAAIRAVIETYRSAPPLRTPVPRDRNGDRYTGGSGI